MYSFNSLALPANLCEDEQALGASRLLVAENIFDTLAANGSSPDAGALAFLQQYINGVATLGQAIGRLVDHLAQDPNYEPQVAF